MKKLLTAVILMTATAAFGQFNNSDDTARMERADRQGAIIVYYRTGRGVSVIDRQWHSRRSGGIVRALARCSRCAEKVMRIP